MIQTKMFLLVLSLFSYTLVFGQELRCESHSIHQLDELRKDNEKPTIVKIYASWCKPCKSLNNTFKDEEIQELIVNNFNMINFDLETAETIKFKGKEYHLIEHEKMNFHELAYELLDKQLNFPAIAIFDENLTLIDLSRGDKTQTELIRYLKEFK